MAIRDRLKEIFAGDEIRQLQEVNETLVAAYQDGPYVLPPEELVRQLSEQYDAGLLQDLVDQLQYERIGGYSSDLEPQRTRAVEESKRTWVYSVVARWLINLWTYYGVGENITVVPDDEGAVEAWDEFWAADRNNPILSPVKLHDISRMLLVKGNRFFIYFLSEQDGEATVRRIKAEEITEIVTHPDDDATPLWYKREWTPKDGTAKTEYYPDWRAFFDEKTRRNYLNKPPGDVAQSNQTTMIVQHVPFNELDDDTLFGWPLLAPAGTPWLRSHREFFQNRLAVARAKSSYVRRRTVTGGSRAVAAVRNTLRSTLQGGATSETNPAPVAGSEDVHNAMISTDDLPMGTGAGDAKVDAEMFSWMAGLSGGVFPHYLGLGDAYRLATATSMEKPLQQQWTLYRGLISGMFRDMCRIVLQSKELHGNASFKTYQAEVSTDRLVEIDTKELTESIGRWYRDEIMPLVETGNMPKETLDKATLFTMRSVYQALGASDPAELVNPEQFEGEEQTGMEEALSEIPASVSRSASITARMFGKALDDLAEQVEKVQPQDNIAEVDRADQERTIQGQLQVVLDEFSEETADAIEQKEEPDYDAFAAALLLILIPFLVSTAMSAVEDQATAVGIDVDPAVFGGMITDWASIYSRELVSGLVDTTRNVVQKATTQYLATPGMTREQLMELLEPAFGQVRAEMIAITETTRAHSAASTEYANWLHVAFGLIVEQIWITARDELVCVICGPLDSQSRSVWAADFPHGPPAHPRCRCGLELQVKKG